jgi:hypothetical protein
MPTATAVAPRRSPSPAPLPPAATWREETFARLRDAEEFLDRLENQSPARRELKIVGNSKFVVRWLP